MVKELKPLSADVYKLPSKTNKRVPELQDVQKRMLELANDLDKIAELTPWAKWVRLNAEDLRRLKKQLDDI